MSTSIQGASAVLTEGKASGPLARMGSLISRVSLSLNRGPSEELEQAKWPCSDSIPSQFFSCPGAAGYKVRGPAYFTDKKKVLVPVRQEVAPLAKPPCGSGTGVRTSHAAIGDPICVTFACSLCGMQAPLSRCRFMTAGLLSVQIGPENCVAKLVSLNLVSLKEPTFHIARFLPSIRDSKAPFIFVWQVRSCSPSLAPTLGITSVY